MGRRFWIGLLTLIGLSLASFVGAGRRADDGGCDTVWDCGDSGTLFLIGLVLAFFAAGWAIAGTIRADQGRRDRRDRR